MVAAAPVGPARSRGAATTPLASAGRGGGGAAARGGSGLLAGRG